MRYFDSGSRNPAHALASWMNEVLNDEVIELRIQTGFFSYDGIGLLIPTLERCKINNFSTRVLIGSNDAATVKNDVVELSDVLGIPRDGASLGIVSFAGAFFHPKTYHIKRADGSQAAFVGSANLTASGMALHVEAGIALDTRDGDAQDQLLQIAGAVDSWFVEQRVGMTLITGRQSIEQLVEEGVLAMVRPPRAEPQERPGVIGGRTIRPRLRRLFTLPAVPLGVAQPPVQAPVALGAPAATATVAAIHLPSVPRSGFPPYLLFEPNAIGSTQGIAALSGAPLPGGAVGLIVQLNKDSARHFLGGGGTANISIPVATVSTLRFGVAGKHNGPTATFGLNIRYVGDNIAIDGGVAATSVKAYGYTSGESGHGDIRMVVPAAVRKLKEQVESIGRIAPTANDFVLLEWPILQNPVFRLSFLDPQSAIFAQAFTSFGEAEANGLLVGKGACWLANGISPSW